MSRKTPEEWQARREEERHREQMMATVIAGMFANGGVSYELVRRNKVVMDGLVELAGQIVAKIGWND